MDHYKEFQDCFQRMSDRQLIASFNREVGNSGWTSSRASYLSALHQEFDARGFDYSCISNKHSLSLRSKIKLVNKKIEKIKGRPRFLCPNCKSIVKKLPLTNYREDGKLWHISHFGFAKCDKCGWKSGAYGQGLIRDEKK